MLYGIILVVFGKFFMIPLWNFETFLWSDFSRDDVYEEEKRRFNLFGRRHWRRDFINNPSSSSLYLWKTQKVSLIYQFIHLRCLKSEHKCQFDTWLTCDRFRPDMNSCVLGHGIFYYMGNMLYLQPNSSKPGHEVHNLIYVHLEMRNFNEIPMNILVIKTKSDLDGHSRSMVVEDKVEVRKCHFWHLSLLTLDRSRSRKPWWQVWESGYLCLLEDTRMMWRYMMKLLNCQSLQHHSLK